MTGNRPTSFGGGRLSGDLMCYRRAGLRMTRRPGANHAGWHALRLTRQGGAATAEVVADTTPCAANVSRC